MPAQTLANLLEVLLPSLPPVLVPPAWRDRLRRAAALVPPCLVAGLECRLGGDSGPVDLWICPALDPGGLSRWGGWLLGQPWPPLAPLGRVLERLAPPWPADRAAWALEFDLEAPEALPLPSSFVTFQAGEPRGDLEATVTGLWTGARGAPPAPEDLAALRALADRCPEGTLAGLGFLDSRPGKPARLMLAVPRASCLEGLLGAGASRAERLLGELPERLVLGMALHPGAEATASLEVYMGAASWPEALGALVREGLCTFERAEALVDLASGTRAPAGTWSSLNHLKLAFGPEGKVAVKAYPAFGFLDLGDWTWN